MPPDAAKLLEDIRDAAQFVVDDTAAETLDSYRQNRRLRQAVERNFEIIGEAMRRLSDLDPTLAGQFTGRAQIIAFRNLLIHGYDGIDNSVVWRVIQDSLPILLNEVEGLIGQTGTPGPR
jgi:uncharacterized protein with HEPN domain